MSEPQAPKEGKLRAYLARNRKRLQAVGATGGVVLGFALVGVLLGEPLWDAVRPVQPMATPQAAAVVTVSALPVQTVAPEATQALEQTPMPVTNAAYEEHTVWLPKSGSRYHMTPTCSGMQDATEVTLAQAKAEGFAPCQRCKPPE